MARRERSAWWGRLLGAVGALAFLALMFFIVQSFLGKSEKPRKYVPQISLIKPPAAPPPPKEDKPPPPPPKREEVKIEQPREAQPTPQAGQPAGKDLGVDADGAGAGDGFGLVGKRGGTDLLASGGGSGAAAATASVNRAQFAFFTNSAQQVLHDEIKRRLGEKTRNRDFRVNYSIWLEPDGSIRRFELQPTGNPEVDLDLKNALAEVRSLKLAPPSDLPQPLRFLFTSRASG